MKGAKFFLSIFFWFVFAALIFNVPKLGIFPLLILITAVLIPPPSDITVKRVLESRKVEVGKQIKVEVAVEVRRGIGIVFVKENPPQVFEVKGRHYGAFFTFPGRRRLKIKYYLTARKRGQYELPKAEVYSFHPFRVHPMKWMLAGNKDKITVISPFKSLRVAPHRIVRSSLAQASMYSRFGFVTTDFKEIREYREGDPFKAINWKATARTGKLLVNEFEKEGKKTIMIFLDARIEKLGSYLENLLDHGVKVAMLLADFYLSMGSNVGLYIIGQGKLVTPTSSKAQKRSIIKALMSASFERDETIDDAFKNLENVLRRFSPQIILITALDDPIIPEISSIKRDVIVVDVLPDYGEFTPLVSLKKKALRNKARKRVIGWVAHKEDPGVVLLRLLGVVS
ncbi:hypothetical protein A3L04_09610 [Thermococcus chitonophagus]|uniref:DUF58 domain-containing protein n=1 Tax=Thermococcus chitonophagus TaxID=54262 RepID=A0A160VSE9_9EURY|nr:DUF58 domain-containing protein [Thermococcus chitonophagus]ASJ17306.1 hypothetical protein A3L04_09610 [Thermococcus chitonophagus]CUX77935.1 FIG00520252: hypothetical protein [Thermococcus chitonophagus]